MEDVIYRVKGESRMSRDHSQNHYGPNASFDGYDSDLASAGILIESLRQQLAEAQAACSMKDELITDACTAPAFYGEQPPEELFLAITIKPGDSAHGRIEELKAALEIAKKGLRHYENRNAAHGTRNPAAIALDDIAATLKGLK